MRNDNRNTSAAKGGMDAEVDAIAPRCGLSPSFIDGDLTGGVGCFTLVMRRCSPADLATESREILRERE
jgi:hypothetical protein